MRTPTQKLPRRRFPDGFTLLDGQGEWRGSRGVVREKSHVLILFHPSSQEQDDKIEALRSIYETRFGQDLVARIRRLGLRGVLICGIAAA